MIIGGAVILAAVAVWWFFIRKPASSIVEPGTDAATDAFAPAGTHVGPKTGAVTA